MSSMAMIVLMAAAAAEGWMNEGDDGERNRPMVFEISSRF